MGFWDNIQVLRSLSHSLMWGAGIFAILAAGATGLRYYIDRRIGELSAAAQAARETRLRTDIDSAQQRQSAAEAEVVALRTRQQPRELSPQQVQLFQTFLREAPGRFVAIESPTGDLEAQRLALQLMSLLRSEGWEAGDNSVGTVYSNIPIEGIRISVRNLDSSQPHVSILQRAFEAIGMPAKIEVDDTSRQPAILLFVGHKPL
jgi:hypothetical protein